MILYADPDEPLYPTTTYSWSILFPIGQFVGGWSTERDPVDAVKQDPRVMELAVPGWVYTIQIMRASIFDPYVVLARLK
jgi:hypothetical protein